MAEISLTAAFSTVPAPEQEAIRRRYADPVPRLFPAAVTFLLPPAIAHGSLGVAR